MADDILSLNRSDFNATLRELADQGMDTTFLRQKYREQNSPFAGLLDYASRQQDRIAEAGRRPIMGGLLSKPVDAVGMDAITQAGFEPAAFISGLLSGGAQAIDAPAAAMRGDLTREEAEQAAIGTAGVAMLGGGVVKRPAGSVGMGGRTSGGNERINVAELLRSEDGQANAAKSYLEGGFAPSNAPVRIAKTPDGRNYLVDGYHRAEWALREGDQTVPFEYVDFEQIRPLFENERSFLPFAPATPAQEVAGLLSSGRAADVTDEMLAKFTPKDEMEIFGLYQRGATGMDLPMDEASRMARAIDAGFDVNDEMYRGDAPRRSFETGRGQRDQIGVTMSTRPDVAASYVPPRGEGGIYPLLSRGENDATVYAGGQNWNVIDPDTQIRFQGGTSPLADYLPEDYFEPYDVMAGTAFADTNDLSRMFQGYGADRVRFNDLVDRGSSAKYYGPESSMPSDVVMVSDPANVRSRFARFDPRLAHLRNLSAGVGGLGLLSSMMPPEEQY